MADKVTFPLDRSKGLLRGVVVAGLAFLTLVMGAATLYLLLSIFVGLGGVFLFVCRHKDDGLPKGIHATYEPIE